MNKLKLAAAVFTSLLMILVLTVTAFAERDEIPISAADTPLLIDGGDGVSGAEPAFRGDNGEYPEELIRQYGKEVLDRQREIDDALFKIHESEIVNQGIRVTHTAPMEGYVEVGIIPYNSENELFIYELLGEEMVKVVEGQQAVLLIPPDYMDQPISSNEEPDLPGVEPPVNRDAQQYSELVQGESDLNAALDVVEDSIMTASDDTQRTVDKVCLYILIAAAICLVLLTALIVKRTIFASPK